MISGPRIALLVGLGASLLTAGAARTYNWGSPAYTWVGHFGGSNRTDIVSANSGNIYVYLSDGSGFLSSTWSVPNAWGSSNTTWVGDFDGSGTTDVASANGRSVYMHLSTGASFTNQTWTTATPVATDGFSWVADFDGDGKTDIASAASGNVFMNLSTGSAFKSAIWTVPNNWGPAARTWIGDFNGDGKADIATAVGSTIEVRRSTGTGFVSSAWSSSATWGTAGLTWIGDFNGDRMTDIASANAGNVYLSLSDGTRFNSATWAVPNAWGGPQYTWVGDFDGNGMTDIASANHGAIAMHLSNGSGFTNSTWTVPDAWGPAATTWIGDYNGDGKSDIASANGNTVYVHLSTGTGFTNTTWGSSTAADSLFSMVFMGDPQFSWSCDAENNSTNDYCSVAANRAKSQAVQGQETNAYQISMLKGINAATLFLKGAVINGDLTRFGSKNDNLDRFDSSYMKLGITVWPGLGNHDYQSGKGQPVNDCGAPAWANYNYCAADMVQYLAAFALGPSVTNRDVTVFTENPLQAGSQRNVSGSLAYSWDIGRFHFVQLNNYPTYTTTFTRGYSSGISSWDINITSPAEWLAADLTAAGADRKFILNWHRLDVYTDPGEQAKLVAMLAPFAGSIKAIFVGHAHQLFGRVSQLVFPAVTTPVPATPTTPAIPVRPAITIPVVYSGSAIYTRFVRADFITTNGCTIVLTVVNTLTGLPSMDSSGNDAVSRIDCS